MAEGKAKVKASAGLNVRKGAGTNYAKLGALTNGTTVTYFGEKNGWLQIKYNNQTAYISKQYTTITQAATSGGGSSKSSGSVQVTCDVLNVRKGNSTGHAIIGTLTKGKVVSYSEEKGGWLKISYNGQAGWICKQYTKKASSGGSSSGGSSSGSTTSSTSTLYVNTSVLNVRNGPGTGNAKIGQVTYGTKLTVVGEKSGWAKIKYGSGHGWVSKQYTSAKAPSSGGGGGTSAGGARADKALAKNSAQVAKEMNTSGWCAKGVSVAVSRTHGFYPYGNGNTIGSSLLSSGRYKKVSLTLASALTIPGLILSWQKTSTKLGSIYGHTAITQGNGKSSSCDFYEYNTLGGSGGRYGLSVYSLK